MNRKVILGGVAAGLASIGIYRIASAQRERENSTTERWTTDDMPDLTGKVIVVTGANSGIGFEAAKEFARKGGRTIMVCRDMDKAQFALTEIRAEIPEATAEIMELDLASQASVRQFAESYRAKYDRIDVLVNNAGIMMAPYEKTEDDFENHLATNHLGHFALTGLLIDMLLKTPGSRVVTVSSGVHLVGNMDFDDLMYQGGRGYTGVGAYGRSKLANLLFTYELQRRFEALGADALAVAAHPGGAVTNLQRYLKEQWYVDMFMPIWRAVAQSAAMGALPTIRAAVDPDVKGGEYYGPDGIAQQRGYPVVVSSSRASHDEADAAELWRVSEALTGVRYLHLDGAQVVN